MTHLDNYEILASKDLHEMQDILAQQDNTHIDIIGKDHEVNASLRAVSFSGLRLMHGTYGDVLTRAQAHEHEEDTRLLFIMTGGTARINHNGEEFDISTKTGLMRDTSVPLTGHQDAFASFVIPMSNDALKKHASAILGDDPCGLDMTFDPQLDLSTSGGQHLRNTVHYIADALNGPLRGIDNPLMLDSLKDLLLTSVLSLLPNSYSDLLHDQSVSKVMPYHLKRARDYIHAHAASAISLETLATHAGCGYRTLQVAFNEFYSMSPMAYVKYVRLTFAHEDLRCADDGVTVREVALKWGFIHIGWFAKCYLEQFGILPSQTLRTRN